MVVDAEVVERVLPEAKGGGETLLEVEVEVFVLENELEEGDFVLEIEPEEDDFVFVTVESVPKTFVDDVEEQTDDEVEDENTPDAVPVNKRSMRPPLDQKLSRDEVLPAV